MSFLQFEQKQETIKYTLYLMENVLLMQEKFADRGGIEKPKKYFVFFKEIRDDALIMGVDPDSVAAMGGLIGELLKITFLVRGGKNVEWMARVTEILDQNDTDFMYSADDLLLKVEFDHLPKERIKTIQHIIGLKKSEIVRAKRIASFRGYLKYTFSLFWKYSLSVAIVVGIAYVFLKLSDQTITEAISEAKKIRAKTESSSHFIDESYTHRKPTKK